MFSWTELYYGMDYAEFLRIEHLMECNHIKIKSKVRSNRDRLSNDVVLGGSPFTLNSSGMNSFNEEYQILVKKDELDKARSLI